MPDRGLTGLGAGLPGVLNLMPRMPSSGSPQSTLRLPRLPLQLAKLLQICERKPRVGNPISLLDDLRVDERAILQIDMASVRPYLS
jgi:hypothetical protein